jgi:hypothetical protein
MTPAGHRNDPGSLEHDGPGRNVGVCLESDRDALRFRLVRLLQLRVEERERAAEIPREVVGSERPVHAAAVGRPVEIETRITRDACDGKCRHRRTQVDGTTRARERGHERVIALGERHPAAVG